MIKLKIGDRVAANTYEGTKIAGTVIDIYLDDDADDGLSYAVQFDNSNGYQDIAFAEDLELII